MSEENKDWKEFFEVYDYIPLSHSGPHERSAYLLTEDFYQAIKARLIDELYVYVRDSQYNGVLKPKNG